MGAAFSFLFLCSFFDLSACVCSCEVTVTSRSHPLFVSHRSLLILLGSSNQIPVPESGERGGIEGWILTPRFRELEIHKTETHLGICPRYSQNYNPIIQGSASALSCSRMPGLDLQVFSQFHCREVENRTLPA